ncbi:MAG: hypothetical protein J7K96_11595, partial [Desulfobacteraceae bacterium]|nr:hypothetical protein [Desulfobacteraceae bacterium]
MNIDEKILNQIISNEFEIDFIEITLTQQTDKDPIIYSGSGSIYQSKDGVLELKMYHKFKNLAKETAHGFQHYEPGKIISEENYFTLE